MAARCIARAVAAAIVAASSVCLPAVAGIRVVASTTDLAALASAITEGSDTVDTIVPAGADAEAYTARPGDIEKLRRADIIVRVGLGYDYWFDRLLVQAGNPGLMRGGDGYVDGSIGIPLLEVRGENVVNEGGHSHGAANPHYWLDPQNAVIVTGGIAEALIRATPEARETIVSRRQRFLTALEARMAAWRAQAAAFSGAKLVAYHNAWPYFVRRFQLDLVDLIEPKPGVAASPAHLAQLIVRGREAGVRAVLLEPHEPAEASRFVAARLGVPVVILAPSVGSIPEARDYFGLFDADIGALAKALAKATR